MAGAPDINASIPKIIDLKHLSPQTNGVLSLVTPEQKINIARHNLSAGFHPKEKAELPYDLLHSQNQTFALYDKALGKGEFGEVVPAQNIETGEWVAIKKMRIVESKEQKVEFEKGYKAELDKITDKLKVAIETKADENAIQKLIQEKETFEKAKENFRDVYIQASTIKNEFKVLTAAQQASGDLIRTVDKKEDRTHEFFLPMKLGKGEPLDKILNQAKKDHPLPQNRVANIATNLLTAFNDLYAKKIIQCDLAQNNILYDVSTNTISLIDYGEARQIQDKKTNVILNNPVGTAPCIPPEILPLMNQDKISGEFSKTPGHYDEKTMVYSCGAMLSGLFDVSKNQNSAYGHWVTNPQGKSSYEYFQERKLLDEKQIPHEDSLKLAILPLLQQMMNTDPKKRPSLSDAIKQLNSIMENHFDPNIQREMIQIDEYKKMSAEEKAELHNKLKNCYEIVLINHHSSEKDIIEVKRELQENKISVNPHIANSNYQADKDFFFRKISPNQVNYIEKKLDDSHHKIKTFINLLIHDTKSLTGMLNDELKKDTKQLITSLQQTSKVLADHTLPLTTRLNALSTINNSIKNASAAELNRSGASIVFQGKINSLQHINVKNSAPNRLITFLTACEGNLKKILDTNPALKKPITHHINDFKIPMTRKRT